MTNEELLEMALDENLRLKLDLELVTQAIEEHRKEGYYGRRNVDVKLWANTLERTKNEE